MRIEEVESTKRVNEGSWTTNVGTVEAGWSIIYGREGGLAR